MQYQSPFRNRLIYIMRIPYADHEGCLKIGETIAPDDIGLAPNSHELNEAARKRISQYTRTAGIRFELLHTELTLFVQDGYFRSFNDKQVHSILERSGVEKVVFDIEGTADEWFRCDLETARAAIAAAKRGESSLQPCKVSHHRSPIQFRPEQREAIDRTKQVLKKSNKMLWNAKMRMGKTLTSLQVVKELNLHRTIIVTHRPVVDEGWFEDFGKIFYESDTPYHYGSRHKGEADVKRLERSGNPYVYFASLQDLRGSQRVGGKFEKNDNLFDICWALLIIDEAHEGTQTSLGKAVQEALTTEHTKVLSLSGTPFNLMEKYTDQEVFTWDYVMEQRAKAEWHSKHPLMPNPYEELPRLNLLTFDLGELHHQFQDSDLAFNFREFFRTDERGEFIHHAEVRRFLDLISSTGDTQYPFSTPALRDLFHHTFWIVPGVREGYALMNMLREHPVFGKSSNYQIVNVAGDEDEESIYNDDALREVQNAIGPHPEETYTITLSCGKLTTGVTVPSWTAVLYLAGSKNTSTQSYMQTIFRVQSPAVIGGRMKTDCYVFDFAPDRTLKMVAEAARINTRPGSTEQSDREALGDFLNFCPIISCQGTRMEVYNVDQLMQQLKRVYVDKVVSSGFEDGHLYSRHLYNLTDDEVALFNELHGIISSTKANRTKNEVDINKQGFDKEEIERQQREARRKEQRELTEEEALARLEQQQRKRQRDAAVSILRGISIRMPLLIYGARLESEDEALTLDRFVQLVDDRSWEEFMPRGVDKARFEMYKRYYDEDIFAASGKQIRSLALAADAMPVGDRVKAIAEIFSSFRNPDKETVLTPWHVVNMHLSDTIGGWCFHNERFDKQPLPEPRWVDRGEVSQSLFRNPEARLLEINSKSGLYPLYLAYSLFRCRKDAEPQADEQTLWQAVLRENIFVICKTEMARSITRRTLCGFTNAKLNTHVYDDLLNQITNRHTEFVQKLTSGQIFKQIHSNMKFDAIVGNPPYQVMDGGAGASAKPVYQHFVNIAKGLTPRYISMIMPARWYAGGKGLDTFREEMLHDNHIRYIKDFVNAIDCFPNTSIGGGVCYFLRDESYHGDCQFVNVIGDKITVQERNLSEYNVFIRFNEAIQIIKKVKSFEKLSLSEIVYPRNPFGFSSSKRGNSKCGKDDYTLITSKGRFYVPSSEVVVNSDVAKSYKVLISKLISEHAGETDNSGKVRVLSNIQILQPNVVCTDSYLIIGKFTTEQEALHLYNYLKLKLTRFLIWMSVSSINLSKDKFQFVPMQDFSHSWTDEMLYAKYRLSDEEIAYIEAAIKPMA